jgi:glycosyltransferase involved in cell wall biosynthesis
VWISSILHWFPTHAAFPLVKLRRKKFLLWTEDWWWPGGPSGALSRPYTRLIIRGTDHFIAAGSRTRDFLVANGVAPHRVTVATNATNDLAASTIDPVVQADLRRRFRPPGTRFVFLYLNRIVPYKGLGALLRAFKSVETRAPGVRLLVCGDGPELPSARELKQSLQLDRVEFVGSVPPAMVPAYYNLADAYVHPAVFAEGRVRAEAWGFTVNEAMSMSRPVIATDAVAAAYDLVEDGVTGFRVRAADEEQLAARMVELAQDPERARAMGVEARKRIELVTPATQAEGFGRALKALGREDGPR